MNKTDIIARFNEHFPGTPKLFAAPGRVNLIGEHTDYNDGYVFPMALDLNTCVAISARPDRNLQIWSENMKETILFSLDSNQARRKHWSDYVAGIAGELEKTGLHLPGADLYIESDVPVGAGLSSSAAIEISSALALAGLVNAPLNGAELAKLGQRAENRFVGMNCGIMDQFISVHGRADHALLLDCRTLDFHQVPLPSQAAHIVVCNTMVKHELGSSEYNKRRAECEEGVSLMRSDYPGITHLRDLSLAQFEKVQHKLSATVTKRCRHVISEDERVLASLTSLQSGNLVRFGRLMNESHDSLRDDYEVSCPELDILVDLARPLPGCLGSRMTGGGFGGCTVSLVVPDQVEAFINSIQAAYLDRTGLVAQVFSTVPSAGAHQMI
jgi:galactokinase